MILKIGKETSEKYFFDADDRGFCSRLPAGQAGITADLSWNIRVNTRCNLRKSAFRTVFHKSYKGFTLIEIIVVLSIIGIILGMSLPFFSQAISSTRLKIAVRDIVATLSTARSYAITKRTDCSVVFDLEKEEYWIEILGSILEKRNKIPEGIDLFNTTFSSQRVIFLPTGALIGPSGSITIIDKGGKRKMIKIVNVTGKVRVE